MNAPFGYNYPYFFRCSWLLLLSVFLFTLETSASPDIPTQTCPTINEISLELATRKEKLLRLKSGLENFTSGKKVTGIPFAALFTIDLNDESAIAQRANELQQTISDPNYANKLLDQLLNCALTIDNLHALAIELPKLQMSVTALRLQFLTQPREKRAAILHPQLEAARQASTVKQLQEEHSSALKIQQQAAQSLARLEQQELTAETGAAGELAVERAELERTRNEFAALQVKWVSNLEQEATFYQEITGKLTKISRFLLQKPTHETLKHEYQKSVEIWRMLVDKPQNAITDSHTLQLPPLPAYPETILRSIDDASKVQQYINAYTDATLFRKTLQEKIDLHLQKSSDLHYRVLLQSGEIRSQLLNLVLDQGDSALLAPSTELFADLRRELTIVPYRWTAIFYLRSFEIKRHLAQGWADFEETAKNVAALIIFLVIPWAVWIGTHYLSVKLNAFRIRLVHQSRTRPLASQLALAIQKLLPYFTWLVMLIAIIITEKILVLTVFAELALLLPYVRYYLYYRLFRQLMQCDFIWVNQQIRAAKLWGIRKQADVFARIFGLSAFLIGSFLTAIESLIRRGLIYHLASRTLFVLGILVILILAYQWRSVISAGFSKLIPGDVGEYLVKKCDSRWGFILTIPGIIILILLFLLRQLGNWSNHFEVTKRIAAEVFRYQLESAIDKATITAYTPPPPEYCKAFTLAGITLPEQLLTPDIDGLSEICTLINDWDNETSLLHSLAIIGHKGSGKTCLLTAVSITISY